MTVDQALLSTVLDRLIPPVGDLPGAGAMGLGAEVEERSRPDERFMSALTTVLDALPSGKAFTSLDPGERDGLLRQAEAAHPPAFGLFLDVAYTAYYMRPDVHQRLEWHGRSPQPDGNDMADFDESVLEIARRRAPLWRKA